MIHRGLSPETGLVFPDLVSIFLWIPSHLLGSMVAK